MAGGLDAELLEAAVGRVRSATPWEEASIAVLAPEGSVIACSDTTQAYSLAATAREVLGFFGDEWRPGDVALINDPYASGWEVGQFSLVHAGSSSTVVVRARVPDIGGFNLGAVTGEAFDVWGEGARFRPLKVAGEGGWKSTALDLVLLNSRTPRLLRSQFAVMRSEADAVAEVADAASPASGPAPALFGHLRPGTYQAERAVESRAGWPQPVVRLTLALDTGRATFDLSRSDPQVAEPINATGGLSGDCCVAAAAALLDEAPTAALVAAIEVLPGTGRVTSARMPVPAALGRFFTARAIHRAVSAAFRAAGADCDEDRWWDEVGRRDLERLVDLDRVTIPEAKRDAILSAERTA